MRNRPNEERRTSRNGQGFPAGAPILPAETGRSGLTGVVKSGSSRADIYDWLIHEMHAETASGIQEASLDQDFGRSSMGLMGQLRDLVSREVAWVRELGADSLTVMLHLSEDTHLHLRLEHREEELEVHIRCEQGDLSVLRANWESLRKALSELRVRLQPLEESLWRREHPVRPGQNPVKSG